MFYASELKTKNANTLCPLSKAQRLGVHSEAMKTMPFSLHRVPDFSVRNVKLKVFAISSALLLHFQSISW